MKRGPKCPYSPEIQRDRICQLIDSDAANQRLREKPRLGNGANILNFMFGSFKRSPFQPVLNMIDCNSTSSRLPTLLFPSKQFAPSPCELSISAKVAQRERSGP